MPSLIGTDVTVNYLKTAPSTRFGTRDLVFLVITATNSGTYDVNLLYKGATTDGFIGAYTDSDSYFTRIVRTVQEFGEVYAVGQPNDTSLVVVCASDTFNRAEVGSHEQPIEPNWFGEIEKALKAAVGNGYKSADNTVGLYNGLFTVKPNNLVGSVLSELSTMPL